MHPNKTEPTLRLTLHRDALAENWRTLDRMSGTAEAGAAVKADGYGLGAGRVVSTLADAGCRSFFVAHWSEVPRLLELVPAGQISVLHGPLGDDDAAYAQRTGIKPVINSLEQARRWIDAGAGVCDLMIDTGMNRLGLALEDLGNPLVSRLEIDTVLSHLACADEDSDANRLQLERARIGFSAVKARRRSLANSAGIALGREYAFDLTRPGLALYGGIPRSELAATIRQVAFPQAAVIQTRHVKAGDRVGYNGTYVAQHDMRTGIVSVGYADGYLRCWSNKGVLQCGNRSLPVVGLVSMDMVAVDLTGAPDIREGDWLDLPWNLPNAAGLSGMSQYELLTTLGRRFAR